MVRKKKTAAEDTVYVWVEDSGGTFWDNFWNVFWVVVVLVFIAYMFIPESEYGTSAVIMDPSLANTESYEFIVASKEDLPISYSIDSDCTNYMFGRIRGAFTSIATETDAMLYFTEVSNNADIKIACPLLAYGGEETYTAGEATLGVIGYSVNGSEIDFYNLAKENIWKFGACENYYDTEIHEILHTFGFDHNEEGGSIMDSDLESCDIESIDEYIIECLKYTYSGGEVGVDCSDREDVVGSLDEVEYEYEYGDCEAGWYDATNSEEDCCPEPNMYIDSEGYCI